MNFEEINGSIYITELPRGYDAAKVYRYLTKWIDEDYIKDFIDSSVNNDVKIELIFKKSHQPKLSEVIEKMSVLSTLVPNYTLISERGVRIFSAPEEIIEIFGAKRLEVVRRRYELLVLDFEKKIRQNNEIIKFIKDKEYEVATKSANRKTFVDYLETKKYTFSEYLADMPIYRMTKEEVEKRQLMVKDDPASLKEFDRVAKSKALIEKKLIEELREVEDKITSWVKMKDQEKIQLQKKIEKDTNKKPIKQKSKK
jgi:DNA gyrase subunit A